MVERSDIRTVLKIGVGLLIVRGTAAILGPAATQVENGDSQAAQRYVAEGVGELAGGTALGIYLYSSRPDNTSNPPPPPVPRPRRRR